MKIKLNTIDIIIPVYKADKSFSKLLYMLKKQTTAFRKLIVIITDPEEEKETSKKYAGALKIRHSIKQAAYIDPESAIRKVFFGDEERIIIRHIAWSDFDHAGTRNIAVKLSDADAFICMTSDAIPGDEYLIKRLQEALERDDRIALSYARQIPKDEASETEKYTRTFNYPPNSIIKSIKDIPKYGVKTYFASNVCCAYNREIYDKIGGFEEPAVFNEDMVYAAHALKKGYFSYYKADAFVIHSHDYTIMEDLQRSFDQGMSQKMHPEIFEGISSESEGIKYVKKTAEYLIKRGHFLSIPGFFTKAAYRYIGFRLGKVYDKLPKGIVLRLCMNKSYVKRYILDDKND